MKLKQKLISWPTFITAMFIAVSVYALNDGPIPYQSKQSIHSQKSIAVPIQLMKRTYGVGVLPIRSDTATAYPPKGALTCVMNDVATQRIIGADLANSNNLCRFNIVVAEKEATFALMIRNGTDSEYIYNIEVMEK